MRKIFYDKYNKKRKLAKIDLLKIRDELTHKDNSSRKKESSPQVSQRTRDEEKRFLLYRLAKEKKSRILKKIGERKYKFL